MLECAALELLEVETLYLLPCPSSLSCSSLQQLASKRIIFCVPFCAPTISLSSVFYVPIPRAISRLHACVLTWAGGRDVSSHSEREVNLSSFTRSARCKPDTP